MHTPIRTALIGHGYVGRTFHAPLIRAERGLELVAIGTRQPETAIACGPGVRLEPDYAALATDAAVDLVVIATPNDTHHPLARAALQAGKHVVIDKPFTVSLAEADDLIALAQRQGRLLSVFHNRRWDGDFLSLQAHIASGALGEVRELISRFDRFEPVPRDRWRERPGPGAGLWFDLGPHLIDQALLLFGAPDWVQADLALLRDGALTNDHAQVMLGYPRRRVTLHCTRLCGQPGPRFEAHGTLGSFHCHGLDIQEDQLKAGLLPGAAGSDRSSGTAGSPAWGEDARPVYLSRGSWPPSPAEARPRLAGDYRAFYRGVCEAVHGRAPNPVPPPQARVVMAVLEAAIQSDREGRRIDVIAA
jgi:predicted dehydrogenase